MTTTDTPWAKFLADAEAQVARARETLATDGTRARVESIGALVQDIAQAEGAVEVFRALKRAADQGASNADLHLHLLSALADSVGLGEYEASRARGRGRAARTVMMHLMRQEG